MLQLPDPHYPTLVFQSALPYSRSYQDWASDVYTPHDEERIVWMRGATFLRWGKSGYWDLVWDRFLEFYKTTILGAEELRRLKIAFIAKANSHIRRKPSHRHFRNPSLRATPGVMSREFGFDGAGLGNWRYAIVNGRLVTVDGYDRVKVMSLLHRQLARVDREAIKAHE